MRVALALALVACGSDPQGEPDWMATIADTRSLAELSMPGITRFYEGLDRKPLTFLDLLWAFEGRKTRCKSTRKRRAR